MGSRLIDMPGARSRSMVTMKLIEPSVVDTPSRILRERVEVDVKPRIEGARGIGRIVEPAGIRRRGKKRN